MAALVPPGSVQMWAAANPPVGWFLCNGAAISRTTYFELFARIGTAYGVGNGTTTFNVPNFTSRVPIGVGASLTTGALRNVGAIGGAETHLMTEAEMPNHWHNANAAGGTPSFIHFVGSSVWNTSYLPPGSPNSFPAASSSLTTGAGGSQPHNNMQPWLAISYIIKA